MTQASPALEENVCNFWNTYLFSFLDIFLFWTPTALTSLLVAPDWWELSFSLLNSSFFSTDYWFSRFKLYKIEISIKLRVKPNKCPKSNRGTPDNTKMRWSWDLKWDLWLENVKFIEILGLAHNVFELLIIYLLFHYFTFD